MNALYQRSLPPLLVIGLWILASPLARASDHADPTLNPPPTQNAGLTGLFVFPKGDQMVVILNLHRGLTTPPPYDVEDYEYTVYMDLESKVSYTEAEDVARYGGTVVRPEGIAPQVLIRFRLDGDAALRAGYPQFEGLDGETSAFPTYTGVRDDPFIFPRFFGTNVIAMAVSVPFSAFSADQEDWIIWATTTKVGGGEQVDHVGRANRTQLGRLDFLNTLTPAEHTTAIREKLASGQKVQATLMRVIGRLPSLSATSGLFEYVLKVRPYDVAPDVLFFTRRRPPGFPNGRRLEDDVAGLTCAQGDCSLQEVASIEGEWPRQTVNDKGFLASFPYLAEPWPDRPTESHVSWGTILFWLLLLGVLASLIVWLRRRARLAEIPYVPPYQGGSQ